MDEGCSAASLPALFRVFLRPLFFGGLAGKEHPKRATIVLVSVFLSVAASMVYVIAVHRYDEPLKGVQ